MRHRAHMRTGYAVFTLLLASLACLLFCVPLPATEAGIGGLEMLRMAEGIALGLATDSRLPSTVEVRRLDATLAKVSAGDALYLMCQGIAEWQAANALPEAIPTPPRSIGPSEIPSSPMPGDSRVVSPGDLVNQCRPLAEMMRALGRVPAGVWAGSTRLTAAEYMGALATLLQYYVYNGSFPSQVGVRPYLPPKEWNPGGTSAAPATEAPPSDSRPAWPGPLPEATGEVTGASGGPVTAADAVQPETYPEPQIGFLPAKGSTISGIAEITILYQGPPALLRVLLRGRAVAISNDSPFVYRWDTRLEPDGPGTITVEAGDRDGRTLCLAQQEYRLVNGNTLSGG